MARVMSASALLLVFLFFSCSISYDITERIGGDVTGFLSSPYSARFYSNETKDIIVQTMYDTIIDNQNFKEVYFNSSQVHLLYSEQYVYRRFEFRDFVIVCPFMNQIVIDKMTDYKSSENSLYSYDYAFKADSLKSIKIGDSIYDNCYFVTTSVIIKAGDEDTSIFEKYILTHEEGIIGIFSDSSFMFLDSIISD